MSCGSRCSHKVEKKSILSQNEERVPELCKKKKKCITGSSYKAFFKKQCTQVTSDDAHERRGDGSSKMDLSASSRKLPDGDSIVISAKTLPSKRKVIKLDEVVCTPARAVGKAINHPMERDVSSTDPKRKRIEKSKNDFPVTPIPGNQNDNPINAEHEATAQDPPMDSRVSPRNSLMGKKENAKKIKGVESKHEKAMESLKEKHKKEIKEFHRSWERKRGVIEHDHKRESAQICSTNTRVVRSCKLKELDEKIASKMKELELKLNKSLKDLLGKHILEKNELQKIDLHPLPPNPVLKNDRSQHSQMCDEEAEVINGTSVHIPSSTCKESNIQANDENISIQPPEKPKNKSFSESPLRKTIHNMEEQAPDGMEAEVDQVKDSSVPELAANDVTRVEESNHGSLEMVPSQIQLDSARVWSVFSTSYAEDPLRIDFERLSKENKLHIQLHEATKLRLKSDEENEIAQIKRKYEAKLLEAEEAFLKKKQEIDGKRMNIGMNRALAMVSRLTNHYEFAEQGSNFPFVNQFNPKGPS